MVPGAKLFYQREGEGGRGEGERKRIEKEKRERVKIGWTLLNFMYLPVKSSVLSATHIHYGIIVNQLSSYQRERMTKNFSLSPLIYLLNFISPASRLTSI